MLTAMEVEYTAAPSRVVPYWHDQPLDICKCDLSGCQL